MRFKRKKPAPVGKVELTLPENITLTINAETGSPGYLKINPEAFDFDDTKMYVCLNYSLWYKDDNNAPGSWLYFEYGTPVEEMAQKIFIKAYNHAVEYNKKRSYEENLPWEEGIPYTMDNKLAVERQYLEV